MVFTVGGMICIFGAVGVQGQGLEAPGTRGAFLMRPETTFQHYCAPCHGETAKGDGRYFGMDLRPLPRDLTDAQYMNQKSDGDLFDSISRGTASIGLSNLCPPWGKTLGRERIEGLVRYVRGLSPASTVQDSSGQTPFVAGHSVGTGSFLRYAAVLAMCVLLAVAAWMQWRNRA